MEYTCPSTISPLSPSVNIQEVHILEMALKINAVSSTIDLKKRPNTICVNPSNGKGNRPAPLHSTLHVGQISRNDATRVHTDPAYNGRKLLWILANSKQKH